MYRKVTKKLLFILVLIIGIGCVPNRRLVYLQNNDLEIIISNTDSLVRDYTSSFEPYKLRKGDVIRVNVGTLTDQEFDFVQKYQEQLGNFQYLQEFGNFNGAVGNNQNIGGFNQNINGGGGNPNSNLITSRLQGFVIDKEGMLEMPIIGKTLAEGLTTDELEKTLQSLLVGYFEKPIVRVQHLSFNFTIVGEVTNPGRYSTLTNKLNIIEALNIAGDPTEFADRGNVKVVRKAESENKIIYLNLLDEKVLASDYFYVQPEDLIIVSPIKARFVSTYAFPNFLSVLTAVTSIATLILLFIRL